ncbi:hypothetical protein MKW92_028765 [Papaver armeniacum]|nr:hypothetical protein MKW92_028765 [Papaver armeniacum]
MGSAVVFMGVFIFLANVFFLFPVLAQEPGGITRHYKFDIKMQNVTRLCHTKSIVTVNGQFPGPRIVAREGDRLVIKVVNHVQNNITLHWHGIRQLRTGWADGPAYVTQCPIRTGQTYVYNFTITGQRGTLWYHAHISWLRSTLYGPIIILPKRNVPYPFVKPYKELPPIIFGEWFNADTEAIVNQAVLTGGGPNVSDAYTMNGFPGPHYNCSDKDTLRLKVEPGKTYLLRLINAALNDDLFFSIANHTFTIVDADAVYIKPFETDTILITPGQTTNVLLTTKSQYPKATYLMEARPYVTGLGTFDNTTTAGFLEYHSPLLTSSNSIKKLQLFRPSLPALNDTIAATNFAKKFRSLANTQFPCNVPKTVQKRFFFTVGLGTQPCAKNQTCQGPNGTRFTASVNNISFVLPTTALLQAHYLGQSNGVYTTDFPINPPKQFNYTGNPPNNTMVSTGSKVVMLPFNTSVEVILQDTSILGAESHPLHLHGYNFYVVGQGFGNYNPNTDPQNYNLIDPVERNTVSVPSGGWVAIRFLADNPGVWFMHCHLEVHTTWGLRMAWVVQDGKLPNQKLIPPPSDLPKSATLLLVLITFLWFSPELVIAKNHAASSSVTRHYRFDIKLQKVTRLCHTKTIVTVNGQFPGPRIIAREGDRVVVKVVNHVKDNITIHWHGIRQLRSGWADGPAYVTQCPIQTGQSYVYNFTIVGQRGTLWWHAHVSWLRSTLYGPIVILPKYIQIEGETGKTYLLCLINAALNDELFFSIANHTLTIVDVDASYIKPLTTETLLITPGQTTNVLLKTKPHFPNAIFLMEARPYATGPGTFDNTTTAAILEYEHPTSKKNKTTSNTKSFPVFRPTLPEINDTSFATKFSNTLRSLASIRFPANVPKKINRRFFFTVGLGTNPCPKNQICQGPTNTTKFAASMNNVSFTMPTTALLQAHFFNQSKGVYTTDFPSNPVFPFNYTGTAPNNTLVSHGTKVVVLPYNTEVELVLQDTSILGAESHPLHLHGFNFYIVGSGFGNFDSNKDPAKFNLVDPVERNTVGVPAGGWVAIRFLADNPGVWFMHCHLEVHTSWGLKMAWIVLDGNSLTRNFHLPRLISPNADHWVNNLNMWSDNAELCNSPCLL